MDAAGARLLDFRIAQQQQWLRAESVQQGLQAPTDPDLELLRRIGDGYREYDAGPLGAERKKLVDGWWVVLA